MHVLDRHPSAVRRAPVDPPLIAQLKQRIATEFKPRWDQQWGGKFVLHGRAAGRDAIRLDGNDYLSITGHPRIVQAQVDALRKEGEFVVQSGVFHLADHPTHALERALAQWVGKEDGFLCQSGFAANVGLLQAVANAQTPVYLDSLAHASLWEGVHAARAPGIAFRHNDPAHLARLIGQHGPGLVVVDSVYSTTGALCPLVDMVEVAEQHGCMILVDESHSLGTHGPQGAGLCVALGLSSRVHFITASLAKAFAGRAGFFTAPAALRYYILSSNFQNIFSSSLLAHEVAALSATLAVIRDSDHARQRLHAHTQRLRQNLGEMGYPIQHGSEQIIALEAGLEPDTMALRDRLEERNVFGAMFCAPATSSKRAMMRLTLSAGLMDTELDHIEAAAREIAPLVKPWEWPIARRLRARSSDQ